MKKMIEFKDQNSKRLFLKYAIPCGWILVNNGEISQTQLDELIQRTKNSQEISENLQEFFPFAFGNLNVTAHHLGKEEIDEQVIRQYFWYKHPEIVQEHKKSQKCLVAPGKITAINSYLEVQTKLGKRKVKYKLISEPRLGEYITTHWHYACEKISKTEFDNINKLLEDRGF